MCEINTEGLEPGPVSLVTFIHGNSKIISECFKNKKISLSGHGNMGEFWDLRDFGLGTTVLVRGCPSPQGAPTEPGLAFQCDSTC